MLTDCSRNPEQYEIHPSNTAGGGHKALLHNKVTYHDTVYYC